MSRSVLVPGGLCRAWLTGVPWGAKVAGSAPVPSPEELTSSLHAAHAAVAAVDVPAADALWQALNGVVALLDCARAERLGLARVLRNLQVCHLVAPRWL